MWLPQSDVQPDHLSKLRLSFNTAYRLPVGPAQPHDGPKSNAIDIENGAGQDRGS
jgi:hypothetical protein